MNPRGVTLQGDSTVWVADFGNNRYSTFDSSGTHLRDVLRPPIGWAFPWVGSFNGRGLVEQQVVPGDEAFLVVDASDPNVVLETVRHPWSHVLVGFRRPAAVRRSESTVVLTAIPYAAEYLVAIV